METTNVSTGGETVYKNNMRMIFMMLGLVGFIGYPIAALLLSSYVDVTILLAIAMVAIVDVAISLYFMGRYPDILISANYFGFRKMFGTTRLRWDKVRVIDNSIGLVIAYSIDGNEKTLVIKGGYLNGEDMMNKINQYKTR